MIWFFQRAGEELRVVTRFDRSSNEYVVGVEWPDQPPQEERYSDYAAFNRRVQDLHGQLLESAWLQSSAPELLQDGWRGPISRG